MIRVLAGVIAASVIVFSAQQAKAQYYIPSYVRMYVPYTQPAPYYYYSVPRYDYRYYPRRRYRSRYYPGYPVYVVPRTTQTVPSEPFDTSVHPSHYFGDPHASQNITNPHRSQTLP